MDWYLDSIHGELCTRFVVYSTLRDIIETISCHYEQTRGIILEQKYLAAEELNDTLVKQIQYLQIHCSQFSETILSVKARAQSTRREFIYDVGSYIADRRCNKLLQDHLATLQNVHDCRLDSNGTTSPRSETHPVILPITPPTSSCMPRLLLELEDNLLLQVFSFLRTEEVLNYAQTNRFVYHRIDGIFDIQSTIVKPEWSILHGINNTAQSLHWPAISNQLEPKLSRDMIDALTKRLSGNVFLN